MLIIQKSDVRVIPYKDCLAKTILLEAGRKPGVSVKTHCLIVGYVAKELLSRLPVWLRENLFPKGSELIAAAHDVGKISPAFQEKIHRDIGKNLGLVNPELDKVIGYHSSVSQATVSSCSKYIPEFWEGITASPLQVLSHLMPEFMAVLVGKKSGWIY